MKGFRKAPRLPAGILAVGTDANLYLPDRKSARLRRFGIKLAVSPVIRWYLPRSDELKDANYAAK